MTKATDLTEQIVTALETVAPVYLFGDRKLDSAAPPFILVQVESDDLQEFRGNAARRVIRYSLDVVLARTEGLTGLQQAHYDILKALTLGELPTTRATESGWPFEESATVDPDQDGSATIRLTSSVAFGYVEKY